MRIISWCNAEVDGLEVPRSYAGKQLNENFRKELKGYAIASILYLLIALLLFMPEIGNVLTTVPGSNGDVYQSLFYLWWAKYALLYHHVGIYSNITLLFYPVGVDTIFQTISPVSGLISIPFQGISLEFAYNLLFFLGFVVGGLGAFVLAGYLLKDRNVAFLAGVFFAFSTIHIAYSIHHLDFFFIGMIPFFVYFFLRMMDGGRRYAFAVAAGASFVLLIFMDEFEEGLMLAMLAAVIVLFYLASRNGRRKVISRHFTLNMGMMAATILILGSFGIMPLIQAVLSPNGLSSAYSLNSLGDNAAWSADVLSFFIPNYIFQGGGGGAAANLFYSSNDRDVYIGYVLIILAAYGLYRNARKQILWIAVFLLFVLLALGPYIKINNLLTPIPGLYLLYRAIPYLNLVREPARFYIIASLAIALLAALGAGKAMHRIRAASISETYVYLFMAAVVATFVIESFGIPTGTDASVTATPSSPSILHALSGSLPRNSSFIVLPSPPVQNYVYSGIADYYVTILDRHLVGGYITRYTSQDAISEYEIPFAEMATYLATYSNQSYYTPPYTSPIDQNLTLQSLKTLSDYNVSLIIVENKAYANGTLDSMYNLTAPIFGRPIYEDGNITVFSTANALRTDFYEKGFISYYNPGHWEYVKTYNGTALFTPFDQFGLVISYAPYPPNSTDAGLQYTNDTMSFIASSPTNQTLTVYTCSCSVTQKVSTDYVPIHAGVHEYELNITLASGPYWNVIEFGDSYLQTQDTGTILLLGRISLNNSKQ